MAAQPAWADAGAPDTGLGLALGNEFLEARLATQRVQRGSTASQLIHQSRSANACSRQRRHSASGRRQEARSRDHSQEHSAAAPPARFHPAKPEHGRHCHKQLRHARARKARRRCGRSIPMRAWRLREPPPSCPFAGSTRRASPESRTPSAARARRPTKAGAPYQNFWRCSRRSPGAAAITGEFGSTLRARSRFAMASSGRFRAELSRPNQ